MSMSTKQALETLDWIKEEMARLRRYEEAFQEWSEKTEWIQASAQSGELGMHRADVFRNRYNAALSRIAELEAQVKCPPAEAKMPDDEELLDTLFAEIEKTRKEGGDASAFFKAKVRFYANVVAAKTKPEKSRTWFRWDGGKCPVSPDAYVVVQTRWSFRNKARHAPRMARSLNWSHSNSDTDIIAYSIDEKKTVAHFEHWIKWDGGECPVPPKSHVFWKLRGFYGSFGPSPAGNMNWGRGDTEKPHDIVAYAVVVAADEDGWIEWNGNDMPNIPMTHLHKGDMQGTVPFSVKYRSGEVRMFINPYRVEWVKFGIAADVMYYRIECLPITENEDGDFKRSWL